nr:RecName: Full=Endo-beta-1,4-glucanase; Short=Endoglucanase; AltName: Full=Carboxymethylcellulase; AltName: Full=Cellulase [Aspergillus versicolor]
VAAIQTVLG